MYYFPFHVKASAGRARLQEAPSAPPHDPVLRRHADSVRLSQSFHLSPPAARSNKRHEVARAGFVDGGSSTCKIRSTDVLAPVGVVRR
jgi:hypothetical protein